MTCREFADVLMDYLSGEMPSNARRRFLSHVHECVNCRRYLKSYIETVKLAQRAFDDEDAALPQGVPDELVQAILAARRR